MLVLINLILVPIFLVALFTFVKFYFSNESKGERGKTILLKANKYSVGLLPIGWLIIEIYHRIFNDVTLDIYRDYMMLLIFIFFIIQGFIIFWNKKQL